MPGSSQSAVTSVTTGGSVVSALVLHCGVCAWRGPEKGDSSEFRRHVIVDAKRQQADLSQEQTDFCQGVC